MASEGASGEQQPPPVQTLATAVLGGVDAKCEFNMDNLSKPELLTLLSIMEGELEARDLVIEALRARRKEVFLQERYGHYSLTDPFLALQRDFECGPGGGDKERRPLGSSPISVLEAVMAHCRKMQERMSAQLAAAESRQKRLEMEKLQLQSLEQEHRKLTAQLKDEREKNKHIVMMLVRECKQLATRVVEEAQRFDELQARLDEESRTSGRLQDELNAERQRGQQMEAKMEKQLSELDTEREQLRARLGREEAESQSLRRQVEQLRTERPDGKEGAAVGQPAAATAASGAEAAPAAAAAPPKPKALTSVAVATEPVACRTTSCQTDLPPAEVEGPKKTPLTIPVKPAPANYVGLSLPKSAGRGIVHSSSGGLAQTENGSEGQTPHAPPSGVSPRVQAARYKFQEQDQNGTASQSPPSRDLSPTNRDNFAAKQQARHTVTQVLSRFTSPPAGGVGPLRPGLPHSASEGGPFPGRLSHPIGLKSPTVARIDRGNPPPIPPKKPGLSQTPSPPHPPIKVVGDGGRSPGAALKPATPQLPPKPALDLVPALTASQVGACPPSPSLGAGRGPQRQPASACAECPPLVCLATATAVSSPSINPPSSTSSSSASAPCSRSPRAPAGSPLATASGWCPPIASSPCSGGPADLDSGRPLLLQAASQGNVTLLSMLLNQPDPTTTNTTSITTSITTTTTSTSVEGKSGRPDQHPHHLHHHQTSALSAAALNGHTDCVKLLLMSGVSADVSDENGFTPLHLAAAHGHRSCVEALLGAGAAVDGDASVDRTPLYLASQAGSVDCVRALLTAGAGRSQPTADGCTVLHAAVRSGHVDTLRLLLCHPAQDDPTATLDPGALALPPALLNQANSEGWTAAHMAAARGLKECLEVLCSHSEQDIERRDKCNRTIHDVATDDCKDLLENLHSYRVQVRLQCFSGGGEGAVEPLCPVEALKEEEEGGGGAGNLVVLGRVCVERTTRWAALGHALGHALTSHLQLLCRDPQQTREEAQHPLLGLSSTSMASVLIGDTVWLPGQELSLSPWDLVRKPLSQRITIRLKGLSELCLDELALESLLPLPLLHNYIRLVEQYGNLIFHGPEGSCQEYIANQIARCIKLKQEAGGVACEVVQVEVDGSLTKDLLLETFINCGFLVPASGRPGSGGQGGGVRHSVVVLLEGLEKASSLPGLLGDLCHSLENRGSAYPLALLSGPHHFREGSFLIGTLSKPCLQGSELRLQQHFRWVTLRWDQEPLHGLLGRHLRRKLLHKMGTGLWAPGCVLERSVAWVSQVWQQLNACLSRLGTLEALLGPQLFLSCPVVPHNTQAIVKWLARLWNAVVVPRVEEAIVSRVTAKRLTPSPQRPSPSSGLSPGQQAVVKAALSILVNKAVLPGCPLPRLEIDRYLLEFRGGTFPLSAIGSCRGSGGGGRKGRDSGMWRRANTSPRKKGSPASSWSCGGSFREGSLSNTDVRFIANGNAQRSAVGEPVGLSVFSDDETDLIRELQTMCSSKSEPDISKIALTNEDLILFSSSPSEATPPHKTRQEVSTQPQPPTTSGHQSRRSPSHAPQSSSSHAPQSSSGHAPQSSLGHAPQSSPKRSGPRAKSQLPVPSSRGQQTRPNASSSSSSISTSTSRTQTPANRSRTDGSSKTRQAPPSNNNNNYRNNVNNNSQSHEDIWILHRDLHENNINNKK